MADGIKTNTAVFLAVNASYAHTNPAAWSLGNVVRDAGWHWEIIEVTAREPLPPLLLRLSRQAPRIIAASFFLFNRAFLLTILSRYKQLYPDCITLGGGPEFLGDNNAFLATHPYMDALIRGEGETALREFLKVWDNPTRWERVPGLCARKPESDTLFDNGYAPYPDLNTLPAPLPGDMQSFRKPFLLFETARGCAAHCVFCTSGAKHILPRYWPLGLVRASLQRLQATNLPEVRFADRTFNDPPERCIELLRLLRDEFPAMRFHLEIDPGCMSEAVMAELALARPGQLYLEVGIQTLTPGVFKRLGRRGQLADCERGVRALCAMRHLQVHTDLIAGLPHATLKDLYIDLQKLIQMQPAVIQLEILKLLPGTPLALHPQRFGLTAAPTPPYEVLATTAMSAADLETAWQLSRLLDWFYNTPDLQPVTLLATEVMADFWDQLADACQKPLALCDTPSLENRFKLMDTFLSARAQDYPHLRHSLHYNRLKHSLTHIYDINLQPWQKPLPPEAVLLEGATPPSRAQIWQAHLDRPYFFVYGNEVRRAISIFVLNL